jgi:predicted nucleic acid-binding protein
VNAGVRRWFTDAASDELFLSVLVVGEIRQGVERLRRRDPKQARVFDQWLGDLRRDYGERILPVTAAIAEEWGRLNAGDPLPAVDGLLAATAKVHDLTLVTRNTGQVERTGAHLLNPFS